MSGFDILKRLTVEIPNSRVLVFTMHEGAVFALLAIEAGAKGYVTKSEGPEILLTAIKTVLAGRIYLSHAMAQGVAPMNISRAGDDPLRKLTSR